jgi:DNA polymerase
MWLIEQHATMDFETRSAAGFHWNGEKNTWIGPPGAEKKKGISAVGTYVYAEHPSTDVLCLYYSLPGDNQPSGWHPGDPPPQRLFDWIATGGLVECHKAMFERAIWHLVMVRKHGWPPIPAKQFRCSMAKARVNNLPGALGDLSKVLPGTEEKDEDGRRLINKFSIPQKPTAKQPNIWLDPATDPIDGPKLYAYCAGDVRTEIDKSNQIMPMTAAELEFWQLDQEMNWRGIAVDRASVRNMTAVLDRALLQYGDEFRIITGGLNPTQVQATQGWLRAKGVFMDALDEEAITEALTRNNLPPEARRVLEIRGLIGSASVKKLYSIDRTAASDDRVRDIIVHHGARTGRPTGDLVQPLNLPKAGPDLVYCEACDKPSKWPPTVCPWCATPMHPLLKKYKWPNTPDHLEHTNPVDAVQEVMATRSLPVVEHFLGDALLSISGCVRGMIVAGPGMELMASDYSAIEAVVTAQLAGCQWRIDTFKRREDIYLVSAAKIVPGRTYEGYIEYFAANGRTHHPDRQKIGKVAELALGFGGWLAAWRQFDSTNNFTDDEVKRNILAWRAASPEIPEMWGGQTRDPIYEKRPTLERFGFEGAFVNAIQYPGHLFESHGIKFYMRKDALIVRLLSGRELVYNSPRLWQNETRAGILDITYMTWNSNAKYGPPGWGPMKTYSGRIAENIVQAVAHDIQRFGILALEAAGYPIILHVYDEDVAEVPIGWGSLEEFERIMGTMPSWAHDWPVRASGGWRGYRYRKA